MNKKSPGAQCSKCCKWLHGVCASISTEQLTALSSTDSIDWKCKSCTGKSKPKRVSVIIPDIDEEESEGEGDSLGRSGTTKSVASEILAEIRREVREVVRQEMQRSLSFYAEKIDDYEKKIQDYEDKLKMMENQCKDVRNLCKNISLANDVMQQKVNKMEQSQLSNDAEICGIPEMANENLQTIAFRVGELLSQKSESIVRVYRKKTARPASTGGGGGARSIAPAPIVVTLRDGARDSWLSAAKTSKLSTKDLGMDLDKELEINVREALSPTTAYLLWKAKNDLKKTDLCKFVWCKNGLILVRIAAEDKRVHLVRSPDDIDRIAKQRRMP